MSDNREKLLIRFIDLLRQKNLCCGFAESCTGGLLSSWITHFSGVSQYFMGSVVSYSNAVKHEVLQVQQSTLENHGAVSAPTAKEMLVGVRKILKVDVAAAITGIAGPTGGTSEKPVGLVFVAVGGPGFEVVEKLQLNGDRSEIQSQSCERALELMIEHLQKI
ncbi:MAG: hypothetical protein RJB66_1167 [Pseudomonadota bacterium]|jgi:PncC family amidohydrolase